MDDDLEPYGLPRPAVTAGNSISLLKDGREAYPAMLAAIDSARRTVHLETYILRADRTGMRFGAALMDAAQRGLQVRLLYDALGSFGLDAGYVRSLRGAGVLTQAYHPLHRRLLRFAKRDHRKILVVDSRIGFVGGMNLADDYAPVEDGGGGWRDNAARVEGPAAWNLDAAFLEVWSGASGERVPLGPESEESHGSAWIGVLTNKSLLRRHHIGRSFRKALKKAVGTIDIASCYFLPDLLTRRMLRQAAARGVAVRIIVPARSDVEIVRYASANLYEELLEGGVRLFEYEGGVLHAKTAVVDKIWGSIGSYNMDPMSVFNNLEVTLNVLDRAFGRALSDAFEADLERSSELTLERWRARPATEKLKERAAFLLRYWL